MNRMGIKQRLIDAVFIILVLSLFVIGDVANAEEDTTPPQIVDTSPSGIITYKSLNLTATTDEYATCKYDTSDEDYTSMANFFTGNETKHTSYLNSLPDNPYTYYVRCDDAYGNFMDSSVTISFVVDTISPTVTKHSPTGKITKSTATLSITTNEDATCKYSTTDSVSYENMEGAFDKTGKTVHTKSLTSLTDNTYHFYVRCKDIAGNIAASDYDASFDVDLAPTAQVTLSDPSPVKAGMVEITLLTSEEVQQTPSLTYSFDGVTGLYIPLTGSGRKWTGYMIIEESSDNKIGSFKFSAIDLNGNIGSIITSGNVFIVDTKKPSIITSISAIGEEDYIKLVWYYDDENVDRYNIYKSTSQGVDYIDFYKSVEENSKFFDHSISSGKTYYYRVAVVDKSGNEGELSKEVHATALLESAEATEEETISLSPKLVGDVDGVTSTVDQVITEADKAITDLGDKQQNIVEALNLVSKVNDKKKELNDLKSELENLKSQDLTKVELDKKLERIGLKIKIIKKDIPDSIILLEESESTQSITINDLEDAINEVNPGLAESERKAYIKKNQQLQNNINVVTSIKIVSVGYLDGTQKDFTLIKKEFSIKEPSELSNIDLIEIIPKPVAESINDIEFKTSGYEVIKEDPIVSWSLDAINDKKSVEYVINKKVALEEAKKTKSIMLLNPEQPKDESKNLVTGFVGVSSFSRINLLGMITGLLVIGCLLAYYFAFVKKGKKFAEERKNIIETIKGMKNLRKSPEIIDKPIESAEKYENLMETESITPEMMIKKDKNTPPYDINQPPPNNRGVNIKDLHPLLNRAHRFIDNLNFNMAVEVYSIILSTYNLLSYEEKQKVNSSITTLYNKLILYLTINEVHTNLENPEQLKEALNNMIKLYNNLAENTPRNIELLKRTRHTYDYFFNLLNKNAMKPF